MCYTPDMITKDELGSKIRELRQKTGKSQEDLGKVLGVTHAAISDIERGKTDLTVTDLSKIANFFEVPVTEFLGAEPDFPAFIQSRDAKDITPEEKKAADKVAIDFINHARELAKKSSDK